MINCTAKGLRANVYSSTRAVVVDLRPLPRAPSMRFELKYLVSECCGTGKYPSGFSVLEGELGRRVSSEGGLGAEQVYSSTSYSDDSGMQTN